MKQIRLIFALLLLILGNTVNAQDFFDLGLKAGVNNSKVSINQNNFNDETINNFLVGAFARVSLGRLYLQPEAYYNSKGGKLSEVLNGVETPSSFDLKSVDVPVLAGVKLINKKDFNVRVMAGPLFTFVTNKDIKGDNDRFDKQDLKDNLSGWQYGVGADFLFLTVDARLESLKDIYDANDAFSLDNKMFVVSLGIKLF